MSHANHPHETRLALYAGGDLGFWENRRVQNHLSRCSSCQTEVRAFHALSGELAGQAGETPADANFARLAQEMTGNIRVGLAAGECIAGFEKTVRSDKPRSFRHAALLMAAASVIVCATLWLNLPRLQMDHLVSAFGQVRNRLRSPAPGPDALVIEASSSSIQVKTNNHALSLMHPDSDGATVSMNTQDSAAVRFVDARSGQVTINKVYYAYAQ